MQSDALHFLAPQQHHRLLRREDMMLWTTFVAFFFFLIACDSLMLQRTRRKTSITSAAVQCTFWICCACAFCGFIFCIRGSEAAFDWWTGYVLEWMLSVDNLFVFQTIFTVFKTPDEQKHKPLFLGIIGAAIFRMLFFIMAEMMIHDFKWMHYVLGAFLIWTGYKMLGGDDDEADPKDNPILQKIFRYVPYVDAYAPEPHFMAKVPVDLQTGEPVLEPSAASALCKLGKPPLELEGRVVVWRHRATRLALVVICLEVTDLLFAVDSVSAIVGQIPDLFLAYTAAVFAMLGLRATFFIIDELVKLFSLLNYAVALILVFIGAKLALKSWIEVPPTIVCPVLMSTLATSMVASVAYERFYGNKDAEDENAVEASA